MSDLNKIADFIAGHDMPMVRVADDSVEFAIECVQITACAGRPDVGAVWCEIETVRSMAEARSALGY
jgi:hypothetical protein